MSMKITTLLRHCFSTDYSHGVKLISSIDNKVPAFATQPFSTRAKCCAVKLLLLGYIAVSVFAFKCVHCVPLEHGQLYLYVQADIHCFTYWQRMMIGVILVWVAPYSVALYAASSLLSSCKISPNEFLLILVFPPSLVVFYVRSLVLEGKLLSEHDAMTAKHILKAGNH